MARVTLGSFRANPNPNPSQPAPVYTGRGFRGLGSRVGLYPRFVLGSRVGLAKRKCLLAAEAAIAILVVCADG